MLGYGCSGFFGRRVLGFGGLGCSGVRALGFRYQGLGLSGLRKQIESIKTRYRYQ